MTGTGRRLVLKDGTKIEDGSAGYFEGTLWLTLPGMTMMDAAAILFNSAKTGTIWFQYGEDEDEYKGYTNCTAMLTEENQISACMKKGA